MGEPVVEEGSAAAEPPADPTLPDPKGKRPRSAAAGSSGSSAAGSEASSSGRKGGAAKPPPKRKGARGGVQQTLSFLDE